MEATGSILDEIQKDDVDSPPRPKSEREKLTEEVKAMIEKTGKKIKTLAEHKAQVQKKAEEQRNESLSRKEQEELRQRAQAERVVRKWEKNYSSEESNIKDDGLKVCYCKHCGQYSMILDVLLNKLPIRKSDKSRVVNEKKRVCKKNMIAGQAKLIKRKAGGIERQYRFFCKQCGLLLCYRSVPENQVGSYTFIVKDALTDSLSEIAELENVSEKKNETSGGGDKEGVTS
mmetsp:Transcript_37915/g.60897  ORF Transcript_37915/g.60897 Transcript_37915/m.60897 type:complete len:230 (+) Transcript_37915:27-716(+)|eukprot:jgi/Bigna1/81580/fgenesh1_pg.82_\